MGLKKRRGFILTRERWIWMWGESALLAGIISNPVKFSPFKNLGVSRGRHLRVLKGMVENGYIKEEDYGRIHERFWKEHNFEKKYRRKKIKEQLNRAPYIVEEVKRKIIKKLKRRLNNDEKKAKHILYTKGWKIYTTIDLELQRKGEEIVQEKLRRYRLRLEKKDGLKKKLLDKVQGALISMEAKTGHIKTIVGGYEYNQYNQYNRAMQARRQPGSVFKPVCYLAGLEGAYISPYSFRMDKYEPIELGLGELWEVKNYNNKYQNKKISITKALKISSNQVASRLVSEMGVRGIRRIMKKTLGLSEGESMRRYPDGQYSIALGTAEMTPMELLMIYGMMANQGVGVKPRLILGIEDVSGGGDLVRRRERE